MKSRVKAANWRYRSVASGILFAAIWVWILSPNLHHNWESVVFWDERFANAFGACMLAVFLAVKTSLTVKEDKPTDFILAGYLFGILKVWSKIYTWQELRIIYISDKGLYCEVGNWTIFVSSSQHLYDEIVGRATNNGNTAETDFEANRPIWSPAASLDMALIKEIRIWLTYGMRNQTISEVMTVLRCDRRQAEEAINEIQRAVAFGL